MALLLTFHPLLRKLWNIVFPIPSDLHKKSVTEQGDARLEQRASFDYRFAIVFLIALHGFSAFKVLAILYINYQLATRLPRRYIPAATWIFNVCMLFANELSQGYKFANIARHITPPSAHKDLLEEDPFLVRWGVWLDSYGGLMGRWEILFNITVLRLISFNLDYYFSLDHRGGSALEVRLNPPSQTPCSALRSLRRSNLTPPISPNVTAWPFPPLPRITASVITSPTRSMRRCILLGPS